MSETSETVAGRSSATASPSLSESAYLERQASAAKEAIVGAFGDLKADLARGADPREWMQSHPWMTLASAAVAGFAAAAATIPSKEEQALKKLKAIDRALHAHREEPSNGHGDGGDHKKIESGGMMAMVLRELIAAIRPTLLALMTARMNPQEASPAADPTRPSEQDV